MHDRDTGSDRRRVQEDEYFRRRDQALIEDQQRRADVAAARDRMAAAIGLSNEDVLVDLELAGYDADTIVLLELTPAVQTVWADGSVSKGERQVLLQIAARDRVTEHSPAYTRLNAWLERRPPDRLFETALRTIEGMLEGLTPEVGAALRRKLIDDCTRVANASAAFLGFGRAVSAEEQQVIDRIAGRRP